MPTVRKRKLARELTELRLQAGLSVDEVAKRLGPSKSTIQRIERAAHLPKEHVLRGMLELYGADSEKAGALLEMRRQAKTVGWWVAYGDILSGVYVELEGTSTRIRSYQASVVPGLLQTEEYARATLDAFHGRQPDNARRVALRVERRTRFMTRQDPPDLHVILDEAVLRRVVGSPEIMRDQIGYLRKVSERTNVTLQLIPFAAGAHIGMAGPFVILEFAEEDYPDVVYAETRAGDLYPEGEPALTGFRVDWGRLTEVALSPPQSAELLADLLKE